VGRTLRRTITVLPYDIRLLGHAGIENGAPDR
jgi:hypothetical protein